MHEWEGETIDDRLDVIKEYGNQAIVSDLCLFTSNVCFLKQNKNARNAYENYYGNYWLKSFDQFNEQFYHITSEGDFTVSKTENEIRPVLKSKKIFNKILLLNKKHNITIKEILCGEYPQYAVSLELEKILEKEFNNNNLISTGKKYTFNKARYYFENKDFDPVVCHEYEYKGKKYIRFESTTEYFSYVCSNGKSYRKGEVVWLEVTPVRWLVDYKSKLLVSKNCLVSNAFFSKKDIQNYIPMKDFKKTSIYKFLNNYMLNELSLNGNFKYKNEYYTDNEINKAVTKFDNLYEKIKTYLLKANIPELNEILNRIIDEYNDQFINGFVNKELPLTLGKNSETQETLTTKMKELLTFLESNASLFKTLDYVNELIRTVNYRSDFSENDWFYNQFKQIINSCKKLDENYKEEILQLCLNDLEKERKKIVGCITKNLTKNSQKCELEYDNVKNFKKYIIKSGIFVKWSMLIKNNYAVQYIKNLTKIKKEISEDIDYQIDDYFIRLALFHINTINITANSIIKTLNEIIERYSSIYMDEKYDAIISELNFLKHKTKGYVNIKIESLVKKDNDADKSEYETIINLLNQLEIELFCWQLKVNSKLKDINFFIKVNEGRKKFKI